MPLTTALKFENNNTEPAYPYSLITGQVVAGWKYNYPKYFNDVRLKYLRQAHFGQPNAAQPHLAIADPSACGLTSLGSHTGFLGWPIS